MVVCGARADKAQFVPFEWPAYAAVWVSVGCGTLAYLAPAPGDADSEAREKLAPLAQLEPTEGRKVAPTEGRKVAPTEGRKRWPRWRVGSG